jgi:hypothetical protein
VPEPPSKASASPGFSRPRGNGVPGGERGQYLAEAAPHLDHIQRWLDTYEPASMAPEVSLPSAVAWHSSRVVPPPGQQVVHDTPVIVGAPAVLRGRGLKALAVCLAVTSVVLALLLWRLAGLITARVA